jgi:uncharacterized protein (TIGR02996 family)
VPVLNEALEAAILRDPDDLEAFAVYGDWLSEQGDPRGELVATQLAAEREPTMEREALRVFAKHRDYFIGQLGSMIATNAFTWRAGFIHTAVLSLDRLLIEDGARVASSLAEVVTALLAHPSARFLVELVIRAHDRNVYNRVVGSQRAVVDAIAATRPLVLRRLQLGDAAYGVAALGNIDQLWPALATVQALRIEGELELGSVDAPALRELALWPMPFRKKVARQLVEARWPVLERLTLNMGNSLDHCAREIVALIHRRDLPALRHLALHAYQQADTLLDELSRAPLLAQLSSLDLRHAKLSDRGVRPILANPSAFRHVAIDLSETAVTEKTLARIASIRKSP